MKFPKEQPVIIGEPRAVVSVLSEPARGRETEAQDQTISLREVEVYFKTLCVKSTINTGVCLAELYAL